MRIGFVPLAVLLALVLAGCAGPSDPAESSNILKIESTLSTGGYARDLSVSDEIVFVAEDQQGFSIYNHVSGTRYCLIDSIGFFNRHFESIPNIAGSLEENLLFVYDTYANNSIYVYDVSDLIDPQYITFFTGDTGNLKDFFIQRNQANSIDLFWSSGSTLKQTIFDGNWTVLPSLEFPNSIEGFDLNDDYIAVAGRQLGFYLVDRSSGALLSTTQTMGDALDVKIVDNRVIVAIREEGFIIFDITDPTAPQPLFSKDAGDLIYTVDAADGYLVLSSHAGGVFLYDISEIDSPKFVGNLRSRDIGYTFKAVLHDGKIFAATRLGIQIITF